jgi:L-aspartate oxidase
MTTSDFLVIGSGIAGLNFALQAGEYGSVCLVTKKDAVESNTNFAQGGIAAVFSKTDSFMLHVRDTLKSGDGLCDKHAVEIMVKQAPDEIKNLMALGATFDKDVKAGGLQLGQEGGHSRKRIVHRGDMTGAEIEKAMIAAAKANGIRIFEKHLAFDLILKDGACIGARVFDIGKRRVVDFFAKSVAIATGGLCEIYENTSNPSIATGGGLAMGFRAGCEVEDIEFVQFHPTALRRKGMPFFLISEAVRGEGARLVNANGKRFVKELALRDEVSRAMLRESKSGNVYLDMTHMGKAFVRERFPTIYRTCLENGIDITKYKIPVEPVAHYTCGGLKTDIDGKTNIPGLYAFGEVACTGVHGANRLASNSLLESLVFSSRAAASAHAYNVMEIGFANTRQMSVSSERPTELKTRLKSVMWKHAGIVRSEKGLIKAIRDISLMQAYMSKKEGVNEEIIEINNMLLAARLVVSAALARTESRGCHFREDYPEKTEEWERHISLKRAGKGILKF